MIDWKISLDTIIMLISIIGGGLYFVSMMKGEIKNIELRMHHLEEQAKNVSNALLSLARHEERFASYELRLVEIARQSADRSQENAKRIEESYRRIEDLYRAFNQMRNWAAMEHNAKIERGGDEN